MKIDQNSSERLSVLRFPLIVGIVFIHAYGVNVALVGGLVGVDSQSFLTGFIQDFISQGVARIAVPLFFLISGYFFFIGFSFSKKGFKQKINTRIKTLIIPFLFWNIFVLCFIALAQYLPVTKVYFSGENIPILNFDVFDYINAILGLNKMPIAYQFWFIRDLIIMVFLSPVIYIFLKKVPKTFFVVIFLCWFFNYWPVYIPSIVACAFFYGGAFFAYSRISLFSLDRFGIAILFLYFIVLVIDISLKNFEVNGLIHNIGIILGVMSALFLSKALVESNAKKILLWAGGCSFFVFAVHEPLLTILKKIIYRAILPDSGVMILFLYIIIPIIVIVLSVVFYLVLKRYMPSVLRVVSGGR